VRLLHSPEFLFASASHSACVMAHVASCCLQAILITLRHALQQASTKALAHEDLVQRRAVLQHIQQFANDYDRLKTCPIPTIRSKVKLSVFNMVVVADTVHQVRGCTEVPDHIQEKCRRRFSGFGESKVVEDGNQILRNTETRGQANKHVCRERRMAELVDSKVFVTHGKVDAAAGQLQNSQRLPMLPPTFFAVTKDSPQEPEDAKLFEGIMHKRTWASFTATSSGSLYYNLCFCRALLSSGRDDSLALAERAWRTSLLQEGMICKATATAHVAFHRGEVAGSMFLVLAVFRDVALATPVHICTSPAGASEYKCSDIQGPLALQPWLVVLQYEDSGSS
jgi:hypothetical protein